MANTATVYEFAEFTLNPAKRELCQNGSKVYLLDRDFEVLLFLIENRPRPLSHDEIIETVWNGTHVESNSVDKAIVNIRKALDDSVSNPHFIKTVRKKGYLFIADVDEVEKTNEISKSKHKEVNVKELLISGIVVLLLALSAVILWKRESLISYFSEKTLFEDDFSANEIDPNRWRTEGGSVKVVDGIMRVSIDATDNGGRLHSSNFSFDPNKPITITSRIKVTYNQMEKNKVYFGGSFFIVPNVHDAEESIDKDAVLNKYARGVNYVNTDFEGIYHEGATGNPVETIAAEGFFLAKPFGRPNEKRSYYANKVGPKMDAVWVTWFEQKMIYDPISGKMEYFIDGGKKSEFDVGVMPQLENPQMRLYIAPGGWWTNHSIELDYVKIAQ